MRPGLIQMVKALTAADRKTLSQKTLKLGEEYGELASAILPYEGADTTQHRFTSAADVLEEVADVMLVAMSIALDLNFSEEDVFSEMTRKAGKWAEKQARHEKGTYPFEIHITVRDAPSIEHFRETCDALGVKPIILALQAQTGELNDVMTSSVIMGDNAAAQAEMERISTGLKTRGYEVVREKIETAPWHPAAPRDPSDPFPPGAYFEAHLAVRLDGDSPPREKLVEMAKVWGAHVSRNIFKINPDGSRTIMVTQRVHHGTVDSFQRSVEQLKFVLEVSGFVVGKLITEYAIYDSNGGHDAKWMERTQHTAPDVVD